MFEKLTNSAQRKGLINLLQFIVSATQTPAGYAFVPKVDAEKLVELEPNFVKLDLGVVNAQGQVKVAATSFAVNALMQQKDLSNSAETEPRTSRQASQYKIVTLNDLPPVIRGGGKTDLYPFETLNPFPQEGNAFFVPATKDRPHPAKTLASTVHAASKRYAKRDGRVFAIRKAKDDMGIEIGAHVIRLK